MSAVLQWKIENTTDATRGQPLAARVLARKVELEDALADCSPHERVQRTAIETALAAVYLLMTGDLAHPPDVIARALSDWLERNKHL
ncbi:MAG: hypothetical protein E6J90_05955 [Deltaproteobacteria bacterium]|nr:MAG: hypothetical protein E6J91_31870 [Deltaproteobacteria bacterium]TMQ25474.1 MAG: hypothetical protein E6J90_05955 [Deltaproteobacteria bacterium]